jgi:hypothetical protein
VGFNTLPFRVNFGVLKTHLWWIYDFVFFFNRLMKSPVKTVTATPTAKIIKS